MDERKRWKKRQIFKYTLRYEIYYFLCIDNIDKEDDACLTHYNVGKTVRRAIEELGGNMPETLPTPKKSIRELEKDVAFV